MVVSPKMSQRFKSVYYVDHPGSSAAEKHLRLAFGRRDNELFGAVGSLTSSEIRNLLGFERFSELVGAAQSDGDSLNAFCLSRLRDSLHVNARPEQQVLFDPLQATFRGGEREPLHQWFPLLEGYSPKFVEEIIHQFCPDARSILDPFAGVGTTPLTAAGLGIRSYYCEINPLLQLLTEVKAQVLSEPEKKRHLMTIRIHEVKDSLERLVRDSKPDEDLRFTYVHTFGLSRFFTDSTFEQILRARTLIDLIACENQLLAQLVLVAVLKALVPCSLLVRAGDLRFRTPEELKREREDFIALVRRNLVQIADDLVRVITTNTKPVLLAEDARNLDRFRPLNVDAVITSPPYLNGTNYARNTKIELWFLRCLQDSTDLAFLRQRSVTAGINDVLKSKNGTNRRRVAAIVRTLERRAYDSRIPRMVSTYFADLDHVFEGVAHHLKPGGILAVDIGDSAYAGIRVATDSLLDDLLREKGLKPVKRVVLRQRTSRSQMLLKQVLLVYLGPEKSKRVSLTKSNGWQRSWTEFKGTLPHQRVPYSSRNWGHPLHSLCSYQGKMKPSLAHYLIKTFFKPGSRILDPFAGVATIPFEGALQGIKAFGFEISPAAWAIAAGKLARPVRDKALEIIDELARYIEKEKVTRQEIERANRLNFNGMIADYFEPRTLSEVLLARRYFLIHFPKDASECFVFASLLHILHGNRPYALSRRSHPITPFAPTGRFEYRPLILRLRGKVERGLAVELPGNFVDGKMFFQDATLWWPSEVSKLDGVVTSPPFFDSTRFYLANWMRLWFCGWELEDFRSRPLAFVDQRQKTSFAVYKPVFRQARERVNPGGILVFHLGKSSKCDMATKIEEAALPWFRVVERFSENVSHCESHGIRDKGTVTAHQFLVLQ